MLPAIGLAEFLFLDAGRLIGRRRPAPLFRSFLVGFQQRLQFLVFRPLTPKAFLLCRECGGLPGQRLLFFAFLPAIQNLLRQSLPPLFQLLPFRLIGIPLFLPFGFLLFQFFQPVVLLQPVLLHVEPRFLLLRFRLPAPGRFQLLLPLFRCCLKVRPLLPGLFQRLSPLFLLFRRQNSGRQGIQFPSQKFLLLLSFFQSYSGLIPEFLNRLKVLLVPKSAPVRAFRQPRPVLLEADFPHQIVVRIPRPAGLLLQPLLQPGVPAGAENAAENLPPLLRLGQQKLEKISLGNHGNLHELIPGHPQNLPDFLVHLSGAGENLSPRQPQFRRCVLLGHALAPQLRPLIGRVPADFIFLITIGKNKLHLRGGIRLRIAGA